MIIRTAYWVGKLSDDNADAFFAGIQRIKPGMCALPGVKDVVLKRPYELEPGPCAHFAELSLLFESRDDLQRMLASDERAAVRAEFAKLAPLFDGSLHHINFEAS
jgi:hypothetical protein